MNKHTGNTPIPMAQDDHENTKKHEKKTSQFFQYLNDCKRLILNVLNAFLDRCKSNFMSLFFAGVEDVFLSRIQNISVEEGIRYVMNSMVFAFVVLSLIAIIVEISDPLYQALSMVELEWVIMVLTLLVGSAALSWAYIAGGNVFLTGAIALFGNVVAAAYCFYQFHYYPFAASVPFSNYQKADDFPEASALNLLTEVPNNEPIESSMGVRCFK